MVPGSTEPSAQDEVDLREHDRDVLEFLSQDPSSRVAFQGLRRRLGIHPEQLSRALHRLAANDLVARTDLGYHVTPKAMSIRPSIAVSEDRPGMTVLQTYLPADVDPQALADGVRGSWVGPLRWYGFSESPSDLTLSWATEDDAIRLDVRMQAGQLSIVADVSSPDRLDEGMRLGHLLFQHLARAVSRDLYAGLNG